MMTKDLEGELAIAECRQILKTFNFGKSLGEDGFTVEFCTKFFELLASDLVESLNTADSDTLKLTNWQPITLLNVDYKIASKVIATQIKNRSAMRTCV